MKALAVLFSGRGSNLDAIATATETGVLKGLARVTLAVTNKPDAGGIAVARAHGIPVATVASQGLAREAFDAELVRVLAPHAPDLVVLAGFMRVLSPVFIGAFPGRVVNIHPADTAAHRGLHGYEWAFAQQLPETWVTVHLVDEGLDTGPVVTKGRVDLRGAATEAEVVARGLAVEHVLYPQAIAALLTQSQR
jgi:phosphoribosylglycinamide formyltransferase-1